MLLWPIYVASNNDMHLGLHVKSLMFMSDFNQTWSLTDFHRSPQNQISCKTVQ